jgi:hypothetical protein
MLGAIPDDDGGVTVRDDVLGLKVEPRRSVTGGVRGRVVVVVVSLS